MRAWSRHKRTTWHSSTKASKANMVSALFVVVEETELQSVPFEVVERDQQSPAEMAAVRAGNPENQATPPNRSPRCFHCSHESKRRNTFHPEQSGR
mmetsp:Transcript_4449/g.13283  ORF Transcript_4449/g.13283 Transcript_4449/m.13283 type:complete len:96 (-) Transcript_4449:139-426(-)